MVTEKESASDSEDRDSEIQAAAQKRLKELKENGYRSVELFRKNKAAFEQQLMDHWQPALDLYDLILLEAQHASIVFQERHRPEAMANKDVLFEVLTRLHERACRTASDVRALLVSGHGEAATARWRTMHEILISAILMDKYGAKLAERYLQYDVVQTWQNVSEYIKFPAAVGQPKVTAEYLAQLDNEVSALCHRYGDVFAQTNGWAADVLGITNPNTRISISKLEKAAGLQKIRPYYSVASNYIHSNVKGFGNTKYWIPGPSLYGLAAPGHSTLAALVDCTNLMMHLRPAEDTQILEIELAELVQEAGQAFQTLYEAEPHEEQAGIFQDEATVSQQPPEEKREE